MDRKAEAELTTIANAADLIAGRLLASGRPASWCTSPEIALLGAAAARLHAAGRALPAAVVAVLETIRGAET